MRLLVGSILAAVALVGGYIAAGGLDYAPAGSPDPCEQREWGETGDLESAAEQFTLSALNGAACDLEVSRAELTQALASEESRREFGEEEGISETELEEAVRQGLLQGIRDGEEAGEINGLVASGLRLVVENMPMDRAIELIQDAGPLLEDGGGVLDAGQDLLDGRGNLLEEGQDLLEQLDGALDP